MSLPGFGFKFFVLLHYCSMNSNCLQFTNNGPCRKDNQSHVNGYRDPEPGIKA
jgi:hypothetical protein